MKTIALLSLPAIIGIAAWLANWAPYYTPIRYTYFPDQFVTGLGLTFVLMLWIGAITSPVALVLTCKKKLTFGLRIASYVLNGIWAPISLTLSILYLGHILA